MEKRPTALGIPRRSPIQVLTPAQLSMCLPLNAPVRITEVKHQYGWVSTWMGDVLNRDATSHCALSMCSKCPQHGGLLAVGAVHLNT